MPLFESMEEVSSVVRLRGKLDARPAREPRFPSVFRREYLNAFGPLAPAHFIALPAKAFQLLREDRVSPAAFDTRADEFHKEHRFDDHNPGSRKPAIKTA